MENRYPRRKQNRLKNYDYSTPGVYFLTFCVKDRKCLLWNNVGARIACPRDVQLSEYGKIVRTAIELIPKKYPMVSVNYYTIMPNHVHLLLQIHGSDESGVLRFPSTATIICQMKGFITKQIGVSIWQKLYHDHIVRSYRQYMRIAEYIYNNPMRWRDDCFYSEY